MNIELSTIVPADTKTSGRRKKGFINHRWTKATRVRADRILEIFSELDAADALPAGPRSIGYRLKERYPGEYAKKDFTTINESITLLRQSGELAWSWVSDASSREYVVGGYSGPGPFLRHVADSYHRDLRQGQEVVVEVYCESKNTAALINRVCADLGVTCYSGGGGPGPALARSAAIRAVRRAVRHDQDTLILGLCDFDGPGIKNILRPHLEGLAAFIYGTDPDGDGTVVASQGKTIFDTDCSVSVRHLALTPEMALDLLALDEQEKHRPEIESYLASGSDLWSRDAELLSGVKKIELEVLNPTDLRDLVVGAVDDVLDQDEIDRVRDEEDQEREEIRNLINETEEE